MTTFQTHNAELVYKSDHVPDVPESVELHLSGETLHAVKAARNFTGSNGAIRSVMVACDCPDLGDRFG